MSTTVHPFQVVDTPDGPPRCGCAHVSLWHPQQEKMLVGFGRDLLVELRGIRSAIDRMASDGLMEGFATIDDAIRSGRNYHR